MTTIHLAISLRTCHDVSGLVASLKDKFSGTPFRLSLHVRPPCGGVAYETLQRTIPDCRLVSAWSEQEGLVAAGASWPCSRLIWWPVDQSGVPTPEQVFELSGYGEAIDMATQKRLVACWSGYRASGEIVSPSGYNFQAVDLPIGPVAFDRRLVASLLLCGDKLAKVPVAAWSLGLAVAMLRRVPSYVVPEDGEVAGHDASDLRRAVGLAVAAGWRSRVV